MKMNLIITITKKELITEIPISWNNASRKLTIGARKGAYEGMLKNRKFTVTLQDGTQKNAIIMGKRVSDKMFWKFVN